MANNTNLIQTFQVGDLEGNLLSDTIAQLEAEVGSAVTNIISSNTANVSITTGGGGVVYIDTVSQGGALAYAQANLAYAAANTANADALSAYTQANNAYAAANGSSGALAYAQANTALLDAQAAYNQANNAYLTANSGAGGAYLTANLAYTEANNAYAQANAVYGVANGAITIGENAYSVANSAVTIAENAYSEANTGGAAVTIAENAYAAANGAITIGENAYAAANSANTFAIDAYNSANSAYASANQAYAAANSANASPGGNTYATGYAVSVNVANQTQFTLTANALNENYVLVAKNGLVQAPLADYQLSQNNVITLSANCHIGDYVSFIIYSSLSMGGGGGGGGNYEVDIYANSVLTLSNGILNFNNSSSINVLSLATGATQANIEFDANQSFIIAPAYGQANNAYGVANLAYAEANTGGAGAANALLAYAEANTANAQANLAYGQANAAYAAANVNSGTVAYAQANAAYAQANAAYTAANINSGTAAYAQANAAYAEANAANAQANTTSATANAGLALAANAYILVNSVVTTLNPTGILTNPASAVKTVPSACTNSSTRTVDASLILNFGLPGWYKFSIGLPLNAVANAAGGFAFDLAYTDTVTTQNVNYLATGYSNAPISYVANANNAIIYMNPVAIAPNLSMFHVEGSMYVANTGNVGVRWGQSQAALNATTLLAGAYFNASLI